MQQEYLARDMDRYHYVLDSLDDIDRLRGMDGPNGIIDLVEIHAEVEHFKDDFLEVTNGRKADNLCKDSWSMLRTRLNPDTALLDPTRRNEFCDVGFTGDRCCQRSPQDFGLSHAEMFSGTKDPEIVELFVEMSNILRTRYPHLSEVLYKDDMRQKFWAGKIHARNIIETMRLHSNDYIKSLLAKHKDRFNCDTVQFAFVYTISKFFWNNTHTDVVRHGISTYGKKGADRFMRNMIKFKTPLETLQNLYNVLPEEQKFVTIGLFPANNEKRKVLNGCHIEKGVLYSIYASAMKKLWNKYPCLGVCEGVMAAFYAAIPQSESPEHFYKISAELFEDPFYLSEENGQSVSMLEECQYLQFGHNFALEIHRRAHLKTYTVVQRHQPHLPSAPTFDQSVKSIECIKELLQHLRALKLQLTGRNAAYYYGIAMEKIKRDVRGAGELVANHVLGVAVWNGDAPLQFGSLAEIAASTKTARFLVEAFNFDREDPNADFIQLLKSVAVLIGRSARVGEEACCLLTKVVKDPTVDFSKIVFTWEDAQEAVREERDGVVVYNVKAMNRYCDVVYDDMYLFEIEGNSVYALDSQGNKQISKPLIADPSMVDILCDK
jgi:hypothetical protein